MVNCIKVNRGCRTSPKRHCDISREFRISTHPGHGFASLFVFPQDHERPAREKYSGAKPLARSLDQFPAEITNAHSVCTSELGHIVLCPTSGPE